MLCNPGTKASNKTNHNPKSLGIFIASKLVLMIFVLAVMFKFMKLNQWFSGVYKSEGYREFYWILVLAVAIEALVAIKLLNYVLDIWLAFKLIKNT